MDIRPCLVSGMASTSGPRPLTIFHGQPIKMAVKKPEHYTDSNDCLKTFAEESYKRLLKSTTVSVCKV